MPSRLTVDMSEFEALGEAVRKQLPFAMANGINETLKDAKREIIRQIPIKLDRPKEFSEKKAVGISYARKRERPIAGSVFIKDIQAEYLKWIIEGGVQTREENPVSPVNIKLTKKHGSIPKLRGGKVFERKGHFIATIGGITGLWKRLKRTKARKEGGVRLMLVMREAKPYRKGMLPFYKIAEGVITNRLPRRMNEEVVKALMDRRR